MKLKKLFSAAAAAMIISGAFPASAPMESMAEISASECVYSRSRVMAPKAVTTTKAAVTTTASTTKKVTTTTKAAATTTAKTTATTAKTTAATTTTTTTTYKPAVQGEPVFHISSTQVYESDARNNSQEVTLTVDGANKLYCDTLIYVYYDKRMQAGQALPGEAAKELTTGQAFGDTNDFIVLTTSGNADVGADGVMWVLSFTLPADCQAGDIFDIRIGDSKYGTIKPLFTNFAYDSKGEAMTKHIFTKGIAEGSITVIEDPPYKLGDINNDKSINAVDASIALTEYASISSGKKTTFTDKRQSLAADTDSSGAINAIDASYILSYYANTSTSSGSTESFEEYMKKTSK